jgi:hypothetical protein
MKTFVVICAIGTATILSSAVAADYAVDGIYSELPHDASEYVQTTVGLAESILGSSKFDHLEIRGRIENVRIRTVRDTLHIVVCDSSARILADDVLKVEPKREQGRIKYVFKRTWELLGSGETGAASGETETTISTDEKNNLRIEEVTAAVGKGLFSSKKPLISRHWRVYPRLPDPPNQALEPTSGTVTPRAEPRVAPVPPVAHL